MRRNVRRTLAVIAGATLALTVAAPAAAYGPTAGSLGCRIYFSDDGTGGSPTTWSDTFTLTQTPVTPRPGQTVTVSFSAAAGSTNGPVGLPAGSVPVFVTVGISGSQTGTVTLQQPNYPATAVAATQKLGGFTATGTFVAGSAGNLGLTVKQIKFANTTASTYCSAAGDRDHKAEPADTSIVQAVTVFDGGVTISSITGQTALTAARGGNTVNFSVTGLAANATLSATLRDNTGGGTDEGTGTGTTGATGTGTGSLVVPANATSGSRTVVVTDGTNTVSAPLTILGTPKISISPAGGGAGTAITVTGSDWNPGSTVTIGGYKALTGAPPPPPSSDPAVTATASGTGGIGTPFTVNDVTTAYIGAQAGQLFALATWTPSADACTAPAAGQCDLKYELTQTVNAGALSMSRGNGTSVVAFRGVTVSTSEQTATGTLPAINVTDLRGGTYGWSLTAAVTDFTGVPIGSIGKDALTWKPACTAHAGVTNAVVAAPGTDGSKVDQATLCSAPAETDGTGGSFDASAELALAVPANQFAGKYTATLTITLS
ncbi:hypothetical protein AB0M02_11390 [Actinoplanes sp. NPDC051861]|uniref:hypothetical protein n=1 Tax=Actinoplanes sp. NPDC051861 TaxID=3155170 RepID=UPI0034359A52